MQLRPVDVIDVGSMLQQQAYNVQLVANGSQHQWSHFEMISSP